MRRRTRGAGGSRGGSARRRDRGSHCQRYTWGREEGSRQEGEGEGRSRWSLGSRVEREEGQGAGHDEDLTSILGLSRWSRSYGGRRWAEDDGRTRPARRSQFASVPIAPALPPIRTTWSIIIIIIRGIRTQGS